MTTSEIFVDTPHGRLFTHVWHHPAGTDRTPIVLLHDSLGCVALWRDFPSALSTATGRVVVAYDRLGFGASDPHPSRLALDFVTDEPRRGLLPVADALRIDRMILFGHSVGGGMAIAAAATAPERVVAVVTESAQAFVEERTLAGIRAARASFQAPEQLARLARHHGAKARWVLDAWTETWLDPAFAGWTLDAELRRVRCPVLALHGDEDEFGSVAFPERIARLPTPPGRAVVVARCGHVPHREHPDLVLRAVVDLVAAL